MTFPTPKKPSTGTNNLHRRPSLERWSTKTRTARHRLHDAYFLLRLPYLHLRASCPTLAYVRADATSHPAFGCSISAWRLLPRLSFYPSSVAERAPLPRSSTPDLQFPLTSSAIQRFPWPHLLSALLLYLSRRFAPHVLAHERHRRRSRHLRCATPRVSTPSPQSVLNSLSPRRTSFATSTSSFSSSAASSPCTPCPPPFSCGYELTADV